MKIELPWPDARLNPNRSKGRHWGATSDLRGRARKEAWALAHQANQDGPRFEVGVDVPVRITFIQPDRRYRDRDNLLAALKPSLDGVADALGINDAQFEPITLSRAFSAKSGVGLVIVEVGNVPV